MFWFYKLIGGNMQILAFSKQEAGKIKHVYVIEKDGKRSFFGVIKGRIRESKREGYDAIILK
jgi:hypothetical protein